jgi:hypothetical protein
MMGGRGFGQGWRARMDSGCFMEAGRDRGGSGPNHAGTDDTSGSSSADSRGVQRPVGSNDSRGRERSAQRSDLRRFRGPGGGIGADGLARGSGGACGLGVQRGGGGRGALSALWFRGSVSGERGDAAGGALALRSGGAHQAARPVPLVWRFFFPLRFGSGDCRRKFR